MRGADEARGNDFGHRLRSSEQLQLPEAIHVEFLEAHSELPHG
jgi:hypothetical protein